MQPSCKRLISARVDFRLVLVRRLYALLLMGMRMHRRYY